MKTAAMVLIPSLLAFGTGWQVHAWKTGSEQATAAREQAQYMARNMVRRDLADQAIAAAAERLAPIVKETQHAAAQDLAVPVSCPASGILADLVVPGAGDRVRWLRARAAAADAAAGQPTLHWPTDSVR